MSTLKKYYVWSQSGAQYTHDEDTISLIAFGFCMHNVLGGTYKMLRLETALQGNCNAWFDESFGSARWWCRELDINVMKSLFVWLQLDIHSMTSAMSVSALITLYPNHAFSTRAISFVQMFNSSQSGLRELACCAEYLYLVLRSVVQTQNHSVHDIPSGYCLLRAVWKLLQVMDFTCLK